MPSEVLGLHLLDAYVHLGQDVEMPAWPHTGPVLVAGTQCRFQVGHSELQVQNLRLYVHVPLPSR
jgi:hypothetical protein